MNSTTRKLKLVKHVIIDHTNMIWLSNPSQTHFFRQLHVNTPLFNSIPLKISSYTAICFFSNFWFIDQLRTFILCRVLGLSLKFDNSVRLNSLFHIPRFITKIFSFVWLFLFCSFTCVYTHRHTHTYISNII